MVSIANATPLEIISHPLLIEPILLVFLVAWIEKRFLGAKRDFKEIWANSMIYWLGFSVYLIFFNKLIYSALKYFEHFRITTFQEQISTWIICYFVVDFFYYWRHRIQHNSRLMWIDHSVHHSSTTLDMSTALRLPWAMAYYAWVSLIPPVLLGFPTQIVVLCFYVNLVYQFLIHHDRVPKLGWLEWFLNTPSHHRVHHGHCKKYFHKNFAGTFIIWDRLFGTFQEEEEIPHEYGARQYSMTSKNPFYIHIKPLLIYLKEKAKTDSHSPSPQ